jgi:tRNA A-37 threonylcarbamoyl transferase component Bud32
MWRTSQTVITPAWRPLLQRHQLESVEAVYRSTAGEIVARSGSSEVRRLCLADGARPVTLYLKKYWVNRPAQLWSGMFRGTFFGRSKARREFENLAWLQARGLDAPGPVAFGEARRAHWLERSFLISEGIPAPLPLDRFIREVLPAWPAGAARRGRDELVRRLADYTRRLHAERFVHHDYFWRNIILSGSSLAHFYLIDAHQGRPWQPGMEQASRAKDLATLDAPAPRFFRRTERLRFFLHYRQQTALRPADKALLRRVLRVAAPMRERQLQRVLGSRGSGR